MKKLSKFIEKWMLPVASWVAQNKYLQTLAQVFQSLLPVIIIGAFSLIISKPFINYEVLTEGTAPYAFFKEWAALCDAYAGPLKFLLGATLGSLSIYATLGVANILSKRYKLETLLTMIVAFVSFILVNSGEIEGGWSTGFFGGEGLFSALLVSFVAVEFYRFLVVKGIGNIKFPDTVPVSLKISISSLLPMGIVMLSFTLLSGILSIGFGTSMPNLIMTALAPLTFAVDTILGVSVVSTFGQIAWWFGIHNDAVLSVVSPIFYSNLAANASAFAEGVASTDLPFIVNQAFFFTFATIGGSGATLGLVILLLRSKSAQCKAVGKLAIVPAFFGINEPVIFGLPIMLNPVMLIPFIFVQIVNIIIAYTAMSVGLVGKTIFYLGGTAPNIISQFFSTLDWRAVVLWFVLVVVDIILWYPFFKVFEKEKLIEEGKSIEIEETEEALHLEEQAA